MLPLAYSSTLLASSLGGSIFSGIDRVSTIILSLSKNVDGLGSKSLVLV